MEFGFQEPWSLIYKWNDDTKGNSSDKRVETKIDQFG